MRVSIAGAGQVGRSIARELLANGHEVTLLERDPAAIQHESVVGGRWVLSDACELSSLEEIGLEHFDVAIAATGDDKANLVHALLAKTEFGVPRTVARVNHPGNEWLFDDQWGVDAAVSTPRLMAALVEEAVGTGDLVRILTFQDSATHLFEVTLSAGSPLVGERVGTLELPPECSLVAIVRGNQPQAPADGTFDVGDKLFFLASEAASSELARIVEAPQSGTTENAGL